MTVRHHVSIGAIARVRRAGDQGGLGNPYKPRGLWYEVDGAWREWCASEQPHWIKGRRLYRVELDGENILRMATAAELDAFTARFMVPTYPGQKMTGPDDMTFGAIDWRAVAAEYDGIEVAPYCYARRLKHMWYYGFDCASGCVWEPRGLRLELEKIL